MKTDLFLSSGHCWVFRICWYIDCNTFTASSFRIWNKSAGIPSPPLTLFVVILPKAHLTSHSRMSGSRWVITPLWLSGSLKLLFYSPSVYPGEGNGTYSIFLPGKSYGRRSLAGYSPWGLKESDMTQWLTHTNNICVLSTVLYIVKQQYCRYQQTILL